MLEKTEEDERENEEEEVFLGQEGGGGDSGLERKRESENRKEFHFFSFSRRPKKKFFGKDCFSLAVTIGAGMTLDPILLRSTRRNHQLGLLSLLTKYNLSLVMGFLDEVGWW